MRPTNAGQWKVVRSLTARWMRRFGLAAVAMSFAHPSWGQVDLRVDDECPTPNLPCVLQTIPGGAQENPDGLLARLRYDPALVRQVDGYVEIKYDFIDGRGEIYNDNTDQRRFFINSVRNWFSTVFGFPVRNRAFVVTLEVAPPDQAPFWIKPLVSFTFDRRGGLELTSNEFVFSGSTGLFMSSANNYEVSIRVREIDTVQFDQAVVDRVFDLAGGLSTAVGLSAVGGAIMSFIDVANLPGYLQNLGELNGLLGTFGTRDEWRRSMTLSTGPGDVGGFIYHFYAPERSLQDHPGFRLRVQLAYSASLYSDAGLPGDVLRRQVLDPAVNRPTSLLAFIQTSPGVVQAEALSTHTSIGDVIAACDAIRGSVQNVLNAIDQAIALDAVIRANERRFSDYWTDQCFTTENGDALKLVGRIPFSVRAEAQEPAEFPVAEVARFRILDLSAKVGQLLRIDFNPNRPVEDRSVTAEAVRSAIYPTAIDSGRPWGVVVYDETSLLTGEPVNGERMTPTAFVRALIASRADYGCVSANLFSTSLQVADPRPNVGSLLAQTADGTTFLLLIRFESRPVNLADPKIVEVTVRYPLESDLQAYASWRSQDTGQRCSLLPALTG